MNPFTTLSAIAAPMPQANIDTDVIMPKQFLKRIDRAGLARGVFHDLRFIDGDPNPDFVLNQPPYDKAEILICGDNFGCGSSREYAVWGLTQLGIRAIIAPSFAGIFFGNCEKNGVLAIELPEDKVAQLIAVVSTPATAQVQIDLPAQTVVAENLEPIAFDIAEARKEALISGRDHVSTTLQQADTIDRFERAQAALRPWLWRGNRQLRSP